MSKFLEEARALQAEHCSRERREFEQARDAEVARLYEALLPEDRKTLVDRIYYDLTIRVPQGAVVGSSWVICYGVPSEYDRLRRQDVIVASWTRMWGKLQEDLFASRGPQKAWKMPETLFLYNGERISPTPYIVLVLRRLLEVFPSPAGLRVEVEHHVGYDDTFHVKATAL